VKASESVTREISRCRICGNDELFPILNLGEQCFTGIFPREAAPEAPRGPLELVKCQAGGGEDACGLVQLRHSSNPGLMYGENYGYRSGLNRAMVEHLRAKVTALGRRAGLRAGDAVVDIGSNDGTLLGLLPEGQFTLVGIDPTGAKFRKYYRGDIELIEDFFSAQACEAALGGRRAQLVTSIAMFYDLERPLDFMRQVHDVLAADGLWHLEQSYLPAMLDHQAYDTVCHEHLEYYALKQIRWMAQRAGLKIIDVQFNDVNGGSFAVTLARAESPLAVDTVLVEKILGQEAARGLDGRGVYEEFGRRVAAHREALRGLLSRLHGQGRLVLGYGASTKGNVVLQYCGLSRAEIPYIAEVNADKFGCVTPGTRIPIISEAEAHALRPDCFLVLPWHFRGTLLERERDFLRRGGRMIFPLPEIEVVAS